jgi:hypothetical protein
VPHARLFYAPPQAFGRKQLARANCFLVELSTQSNQRYAFGFTQNFCKRRCRAKIISYSFAEYPIIYLIKED